MFNPVELDIDPRWRASRTSRLTVLIDDLLDKAIRQILQEDDGKDIVQQMVLQQRIANVRYDFTTKTGVLEHHFNGAQISNMKPSFHDAPGVQCSPPNVEGSRNHSKRNAVRSKGAYTLIFVSMINKQVLCSPVLPCILPYYKVHDGVDICTLRGRRLLNKMDRFVMTFTPNWRQVIFHYSESEHHP